jgi:hypothetical protein
MNYFEAVAAMVREGVKVGRKVWPEGVFVYYKDGEIFNPSDCYINVDAIDYTIYQEPSKTKMWYKVFYRNETRICESYWLPSLEEVKEYGNRLVTHEERQFPEVGE